MTFFSLFNLSTFFSGTPAGSLKSCNFFDNLKLPESPPQLIIDKTNVETLQDCKDYCDVRVECMSYFYTSEEKDCKIMKTTLEEHSGVNFTNIFCATFALKDPKDAKRH